MPTDVVGNLTPRQLGKEDLEQCMALSSAAGWNQTSSDWLFMLRMGEPIGLKTDGGKLVATAILLPTTESVGWIAMVLVDEAYRRQGFGSLLIDSLISESTYPCLALDATEYGLKLYERAGFHPLEKIIRYRARRGDIQDSHAGEPQESMPGKSLRGLPRSLMDRPEVSVIVKGSAFALVRPGRIAWHIGPVGSESELDAAEVVRLCLERIAGEVLMDVPARLGTFTRRLEHLGFQRDRSFTRMARGGSFLVEPGIFAVAGPEYG